MGDVVDEDPPWWLYEQDPLTALVERQHGIIARWQALRFLSPKALKHRIASQRWHPVHRGVYRTHGGRTPEQRPWIAVLAAGPHTKESGPVLLGGISALQTHGLRAITSDRIHVVVGERRRFTPPEGVVVHRVRIADEDIHPCSHPPTTTIGRVAVEIDGVQHDEDLAQRWDDIDRDTDLQLAGYQVLRVRVHEVRQQPAMVAAKLRRLLDLAGWRASGA